MGLMPLAIGMPMRCSDVVEASTDAECVLTGCPLSLYFDDRTRMCLNTEDATVVVVEAVPKKQSWIPDANGNIRVHRFGFQLVPDLAGAIHSFVGTSLDAAMLDCLEINQTPSHADEIERLFGKDTCAHEGRLTRRKAFLPNAFPPRPFAGSEIICGVSARRDFRRGLREGMGRCSAEHPSSGEETRETQISLRCM